MKLRKGYEQWVAGLEDTESFGVRTLIPFAGDVADGTSDRLFAVTNEGIWDVTEQNAAPTLKVAFIVQNNDAGYGVYTRYTTDAELDIVFYADSINGLFTYDPVADTWAESTGITGVTTTLINFVMVHKQRIWFATRGGTIGYYLPVGSLAGEAKPFYFGSKFKHGGALVGLHSWSVDGGAGLDDYLVVISRGGDILPYQGSDPESEWQNVGTYFIGEVPKGPKIAADVGGDLVILSEFGVTAMSELLRGPTSAAQPSRESVAFNVAVLVRQDVEALSDEDGWEVRYAPSEGLLLINTPPRVNGERIQYVYSRATQGWAYLRGVPIDCIDTWQGVPYFGYGSTIQRFDAARDGVAEGDQGTDIPFSIQHAYSHFGAPAQYKRIELIRPTFIGQTEPAFIVAARYDYNVTEITNSAGFTTSEGDVWDAGIWDLSKWSTDGFVTGYQVLGAVGIGRAASIAIAGRGVAGTILVSTDVMWRSGGVL